MDVEIKGNILAVVTTDEKKILCGGVPVFLAEDKEEQEKVSLKLSKITSGTIHDLENGCYIIVSH